MFAYLLRRSALAGLMLFGLICLTFIIANVAPSDPAVLAAGPDAGRSQIEQARREYGLDKPLPEQFLRYVGDLLHGEFGRSVATGRPVGHDLARYFPATLELCLLAMAIGLVIGISLGMLSALFKDQWLDHITRIFAVSGIALPPFWFGLLLQLGFAVWLGWLPTSGRIGVSTDPGDPITGLLLVDALLRGNGALFWQGLSYIALPALGPCYYRASRFVWLSLAPYAQQLQSMLIADYIRFRSDASYYEMKLYRGVAALPSLHVAVLALFAIGTWRWRALSILLWALTAVTFVGSMALAWHYAVDGYLGVVIAYGCWWLAGRVSAPARAPVAREAVR